MLSESVCSEYRDYSVGKNLIDSFVEAGLLQFGRFGANGIPFELNLQLLPAYPGILRNIAEQAHTLFEEVRFDRLVCAFDSTPFGVALSLQSDIPLVYSRGSDLSGVYDLVGAYDVGHPALLLVNVWEDNSDVHQLVGKARHVGLEIDTVLTIVDYGIKSPNGLSVWSLLYLAEAVVRLVDAGRLPPGQGRAVLDWLGSNGMLKEEQGGGHLHLEQHPPE